MFLLLLTFLNQMKDINHENVNAFIGACIKNLSLVVVSAFCSRGNLQVAIKFMFHKSPEC
jgi:uncharacterized membrane protein YadS